MKHVIKKGESLEKIAKEHNVTVKEIIEDNKIKDRNRLGVGNILKIKETADKEVVNNEKK